MTFRRRAFDRRKKNSASPPFSNNTNNDLTLTPEEDAEFSETAREPRLAPSLADVRLGCPLLAPRPSGSRAH